MRNHVVARNIDCGVWYQFADGLLRPVHCLRQRRSGHADANMLNRRWIHTRGLSSLPDHCLQVFPAAFLAHARQLAACARGLAQQLRAIAHGAVRLGASGVYTQVQWHDWTLIHLPTTFTFAFKHFSPIMACQTKPIHATANCRRNHHRCISDWHYSLWAKVPEGPKVTARLFSG